MNRKTFFCMPFLLILTGLAFWAYPDAPDKETGKGSRIAAPGLEDIRRAVVQASPSLKKLNLAKQNQALAKISSYFKYFPSLSAGASASYPFLESSAPQGGALDKLSAALRFSVTESFTFFDGGKSAVERSGLALDDSALDAETTAGLFKAMEDADNAYFSCLEAAAALEAAELQVEINSLALEAAEIRRAGGLLSQGDYLLALSDKSGAAASLSGAETTLSLAKSRLEQLSGLKNVHELLPLNFEDYEPLLTRISAWTLEEMDGLYQTLKTSLGKRSPALRTAYISLKRAENSYKISKSEFFPSLDLSVSFNTDYSFVREGASADPLSYGASVSLSGRIPLDYWVLANNARRQKNSLESSRIDYEDTLASFDIELRSALFSLAGNARTVIAARQQAEYSALLLEHQRELFSLAGASMSSFLDAASRAHSGAVQKIQAEFSFLRGLSALKNMGAFEDAELFRLLEK